MSRYEKELNTIIDTLFPAWETNTLDLDEVVNCIDSPFPIMFSRSPCTCTYPRVCAEERLDIGFNAYNTDSESIGYLDGLNNIYYGRTYAYTLGLELAKLIDWQK
jgi:hypothetical protein